MNGHFGRTVRLSAAATVLAVCAASAAWANSQWSTGSRATQDMVKTRMGAPLGSSPAPLMVEPVAPSMAEPVAPSMAEPVAPARRATSGALPVAAAPKARRSYGWFETPRYPPDGGAEAAVAPTTQMASAESSIGPDWIRAPDNPGLGGVLSEVRFGVLDHDTGPISSDTEDGVDINVELLFNSPEIFKYILWARPHIGGSANTAGETSQGYFGLTWTADIYENFFVEFSFGGSLHDGKRNADQDDRNDLGCTLLFRESISAGVIFAERHSLSAMFDHISNAGFCDDNDGQDTFGVRYGYRF